MDEAEALVQDQAPVVAMVDDDEFALTGEPEPPWTVELVPGEPLAPEAPRGRSVCGKPEDGAYRAMVFHKADGNWYEVCDLSVAEVLPQQVALAETYVQIYELRPPERTAPGTAAGVSRMET